jgi:hypothetical protein
LPCTPGGIRTPNLLILSQTPLPVRLPGHFATLPSQGSPVRVGAPCAESNGAASLERDTRFELVTSAWRAEMLPLHQSRSTQPDRIRLGPSPASEPSVTPESNRLRDHGKVTCDHYTSDARKAGHFSTARWRPRGCCDKGGQPGRCCLAPPSANRTGLEPVAFGSTVRCSDP